MKIKIYDGSIQRFFERLERNRKFRRFDWWACKSIKPIGLRIWWHRLWVRKHHNHPSYSYDPDIQGYLKAKYLMSWPVGASLTWYDVCLVHRRRHTRQQKIDYSVGPIKLELRHIRGLPLCHVPRQPMLA
jgi:hypothetical protein